MVVIVPVENLKKYSCNRLQERHRFLSSEIIRLQKGRRGSSSKDRSKRASGIIRTGKELKKTRKVLKDKKCKR